jgi:hypothetical protein
VVDSGVVILVCFVPLAVLFLALDGPAPGAHVATVARTAGAVLLGALVAALLADAPVPVLCRLLKEHVFFHWRLGGGRWLGTLRVGGNRVEIRPGWPPVLGAMVVPVRSHGSAVVHGRRFLLAMLAYRAAGCAALLYAGGFARAMGWGAVALLAPVSVGDIGVGVWRWLRAAFRRTPADTDTGPGMAGARVLRALQDGRAAEGRRLLDAGDVAEPYASVLDLRVALAEGRYERAAALAAAGCAGAGDDEDRVVEALARYLLAVGLGVEAGVWPRETGIPAFVAARTRLRAFSPHLSRAYGIEALVHLLDGRPGQAAEEAGIWLRVRDEADGRALLLCTIAVARHREGRVREARVALARASRVFPELRWVRTVAAILAGPASAVGGG